MKPEVIFPQPQKHRSGEVETFSKLPQSRLVFLAAMLFCSQFVYGCSVRDEPCFVTTYSDLIQKDVRDKISDPLGETSSKIKQQLIVGLNRRDDWGDDCYRKFSVLLGVVDDNRDVLLPKTEEVFSLLVGFAEQSRISTASPLELMWFDRDRIRVLSLALDLKPGDQKVLSRLEYLVENSTAFSDRIGAGILLGCNYQDNQYPGTQERIHGMANNLVSGDRREALALLLALEDGELDNIARAALSDWDKDVRHAAMTIIQLQKRQVDPVQEGPHRGVLMQKGFISLVSSPLYPLASMSGMSLHLVNERCRRGLCDDSDSFFSLPLTFTNGMIFGLFQGIVPSIFNTLAGAFEVITLGSIDVSRADLLLAPFSSHPHPRFFPIEDIIKMRDEEPTCQ